MPHLRHGPGGVALQGRGGPRIARDEAGRSRVHLPDAPADQIRQARRMPHLRHGPRCRSEQGRSACRAWFRRRGAARRPRRSRALPRAARPGQREDRGGPDPAVERRHLGPGQDHLRRDPTLADYRLARRPHREAHRERDGRSRLEGPAYRHPVQPRGDRHHAGVPGGPALLQADAQLGVSRPRRGLQELARSLPPAPQALGRHRRPDQAAGAHAEADPGPRRQRPLLGSGAEEARPAGAVRQDRRRTLRSGGPFAGLGRGRRLRSPDGGRQGRPPRHPHQSGVSRQDLRGQGHLHHPLPQPRDPQHEGARGARQPGRPLEARHVRHGVPPGAGLAGPGRPRFGRARHRKAPTRLRRNHPGLLPPPRSLAGS
ncbi:hypothetical protein D3C87_909850 [compost metagenome]